MTSINLRDGSTTALERAQLSLRSRLRVEFSIEELANIALSSLDAEEFADSVFTAVCGTSDPEQGVLPGHNAHGFPSGVQS